MDINTYPARLVLLGPITLITFREEKKLKREVGTEHLNRHEDGCCLMMYVTDSVALNQVFSIVVRYRPVRVSVRTRGLERPSCSIRQLVQAHARILPRLGSQPLPGESCLFMSSYHSTPYCLSLHIAVKGIHKSSNGFHPEDGDGGFL
jgi:hypothetical protein